MQRSLSSFSSKQSRPSRGDHQGGTSTTSSRRGSRVLGTGVGGGGASSGGGGNAGGFLTSYLHFMNPAKAPRLPSPIPIDESEVDAFSQQLFMRTAAVRAYPTVENWFRQHAVLLEQEALGKNALVDTREKVEIPDAFQRIRTLREDQRVGKEKMMNQFEEVYHCAGFQEQVGNACLQSFARYGKHYLSQLEAIEQTLKQRRTDAEEWTVRGERERVEERMKRFTEKFVRLRVRMEDDVRRLQRSSALEMGRLRLAFEDCLAEIRDVVSWYVLQHSRGTKFHLTSDNSNNGHTPQQRFGKTKRAQMLSILGEDNPYYIQHTVTSRAEEKKNKKRRVGKGMLGMRENHAKGEIGESSSSGTYPRAVSPLRITGHSEEKNGLHGGGGREKGFARIGSLPWSSSSLSTSPAVGETGKESHRTNPYPGGLAGLSLKEKQEMSLSGSVIVMGREALKSLSTVSAPTSPPRSPATHDEGKVFHSRPPLHSDSNALVNGTSSEVVREEDSGVDGAQNPWKKNEKRRSYFCESEGGESSHASHRTSNEKRSHVSHQDSRRSSKPSSVGGSSSSSSSSSTGSCSPGAGAGRRHRHPTREAPSRSPSFIHSVEDHPLLDEEENLKLLLHRQERHQKHHLAAIQKKRNQQIIALKEVFKKEKRDLKIGLEHRSLSGGARMAPYGVVEGGGASKALSKSITSRGEKEGDGNPVEQRTKSTKRGGGGSHHSRTTTIHTVLAKPGKGKTNNHQKPNPTGLEKESEREKHRKERFNASSHNNEDEDEEIDYFSEGAPRRPRSPDLSTEGNSSLPYRLSGCPSSLASFSRTSPPPAVSSRSNNVSFSSGKESSRSMSSSSNKNSGGGGKERAFMAADPARSSSSFFPGREGRARKSISGGSVCTVTLASTSILGDEENDDEAGMPAPSSPPSAAILNLPHPPIEELLSKVHETMEKHPVNLSPYESIQERKRRRRDSRRRSSWGSTFSSASKRRGSSISSLLQSTVAMDAKQMASLADREKNKKRMEGVEEKNRNRRISMLPGGMGEERKLGGGDEEEEEVGRGGEKAGISSGIKYSSRRGSKAYEKGDASKRRKSLGNTGGGSGSGGNSFLPSFLPSRSHPSRRSSVLEAGGKGKTGGLSSSRVSPVTLPPTRSLAALEMLSLPASFPSPPPPLSSSLSSDIAGGGEGCNGGGHRGENASSTGSGSSCGAAGGGPWKTRSLAERHRRRKSVGVNRQESSPSSRLGLGEKGIGSPSGGDGGVCGGNNTTLLPSISGGSAHGGGGQHLPPEDTSTTSSPPLGLYSWPPSVSLPDGEGSSCTGAAMGGGREEGRVGDQGCPPTKTASLSLPLHGVGSTTTSTAVAVVKREVKEEGQQKKMTIKHQEDNKNNNSKNTNANATRSEMMEEEGPGISSASHPIGSLGVGRVREKQLEGKGKSNVNHTPSLELTKEMSITPSQQHEENSKKEGEDHKTQRKCTASPKVVRQHSLIPSGSAGKKKVNDTTTTGLVPVLPSLTLLPQSFPKKIFRFRPRRPSTPIMPPTSTSAGSEGAGSGPEASFISTEQLQQLVTSLSEEAVELKQLLSHSISRSSLLLERLGHLQTAADKLLVSNVRIRHDKEALREEIHQKSSRQQHLQETANLCRLQEEFDATLLREEQETVLEDLKEVLLLRKAELAHTEDEIKILTKKITDQDTLLLRIQNFWRHHATVMRNACQEEGPDEQRRREEEEKEHEEFERSKKGVGGRFVRGGGGSGGPFRNSGMNDEYHQDRHQEKTAQAWSVGANGEGMEDNLLSWVPPEQQQDEEKESSTTENAMDGSSKDCFVQETPFSPSGNCSLSGSSPLSPRSQKTSAEGPPERSPQRRSTMRPSVSPSPAAPSSTPFSSLPVTHEPNGSDSIKTNPHLPNPTSSPEEDSFKHNVHQRLEVPVRRPYTNGSSDSRDLKTASSPSSPTLLNLPSASKGESHSGTSPASSRSTTSSNSSTCGESHGGMMRNSSKPTAALQHMEAKTSSAIFSNPVSSSLVESLLREWKEQNSKDMTPIYMLDLRDMDEIAEFIYSVFEAH